MNPLNSMIQNGPFVRAQKIVVYGPEAVGKTTLASKFPSPIIFDVEDGSLQLDVKRVRALEGETFFNAIRSLAKAEQMPCKTIVIDSIDQVETYVRDRVLRVHQLKTIEGVPYGGGWALFRQEFGRLLTEFDRFIQRGVHVVVISHATTRHFQSPMNDAPYDRFELNLYQPNAQKLKQWCDALLYLDWETRVVENRSGKGRGIGGTSRVLHTQHCAAFDAKIRISLSEKLPCQFDAVSPLLGQQQEEVNTEATTAADASASLENTAPPPPINPDLHDRLLDVIGNLDKDDVRHYLAAKKRISKSGWIDELSANQVTWIINHAEEFRTAVQKFANEPF
jgi:AAA domain